MRVVIYGKGLRMCHAHTGSALGYTLGAGERKEGSHGWGCLLVILIFLGSLAKHCLLHQRWVSVLLFVG